MQADYVTCDVLVLEVRDKAALMCAPCVDEEHWIPRSLIHGSDDRELEANADASQLVRIMRWKAEECELDR